ncbi:MAG: hypothetical protein ACRD9R_17255, partial [Pyrinomonadaceae bacterium]
MRKLTLFVMSVLTLFIINAACSGERATVLAVAELPSDGPLPLAQQDATLQTPKFVAVEGADLAAKLEAAA